MESNRLNPLSDQTPKEVLSLLQNMADFELTQQMADTAEFIVSKLGKEFTVQDVVTACENVPDIREFAVRLGASCLPGNGYKAIFDREFSGLNY